MHDLNFSDWPRYEPDEIAAVTRVLESGRVNYWTGEESRKFEKEFAEYHGAKYGVAVANGTVALGIGEGDEVVVTPRTFIASASCIVNADARPVFETFAKPEQVSVGSSIKCNSRHAGPRSGIQST